MGQNSITAPLHSCPQQPSYFKSMHLFLSNKEYGHCMWILMLKDQLNAHLQLTQLISLNTRSSGQQLSSWMSGDWFGFDNGFRHFLNIDIMYEMVNDSHRHLHRFKDEILLTSFAMRTETKCEIANAVPIVGCQPPQLSSTGYRLHSK